MQEKTRGSIELFQKRWQRAGLEEKDLVDFVSAIDLSDVIDDIYIKGTPRPDVIFGSFSVKRDEFDKLSKRLLDFKNLRVSKLEVFPYGIPVIDRVRVNVEVMRGY
jgi:hypothetical protein